MLYRPKLLGIPLYPIAVLVSSLVVGGEPTDRRRREASSEARGHGMLLRATVRRLIPIGESVWIDVTIVNESVEPTVVVHERRAYTVFSLDLRRITGDDDQAVPMTDFGRLALRRQARGDARRVSYPILPGYGLRYRLSLSRLFHLAELGRYRLSVSTDSVSWPEGLRCPVIRALEFSIDTGRSPVAFVVADGTPVSDEATYRAKARERGAEWVKSQKQRK